MEPKEALSATRTVLVLRNWAWYRGNAANFLCMACHMSATLLPLFWKRQGFIDQEIGWLAAGFSLAAIGTRAKLGDWMERWGRRPFLLLGCVLLTLLPLAYQLLGVDFLPWFLIRVMQGAGLAFYITAILTWVADLSPPEKIGQLQGIFGVSGLLGSAVGPMVAESIYQLYGFDKMFLAIGLAGAVSVSLVATLPETRVVGDPSGESADHRMKFRTHRAMVTVTLAFGWMVGTIITFLAPYTDSVNLPKVGLYYAGFALASVTVRLVSGSFIDRVSASRMVGVSGGLMVLSGLGLACLETYPNTAVLFSAAILNGVGHGFLFPGLSAYTVRRSDKRRRGAGLALFTGMFDGGILLGSVASGYISAHFGYPWAYGTAASLLLAALPVFAALDESVEPIEAPHLGSLHVDQDLEGIAGGGRDAASF